MKNLIFQHPAWLSYPNIKSYELHPRLPICVGYWDGTTTGIAPNANPLQNSGIIADLLRLTDNPKSPHLIQTHLTTVKSSRSPSSILRMAITIHIRPIGDDSDDSDNNTQPAIKREDTDSESPFTSSTPLVKLKQPISSLRSNIRSTSQSFAPSRKIPEPETTDNDTTTSGSTTQEDTPPPSYLSSKHTSSTLTTSTFNTQSHSQLDSERPTTPTTSVITRSASGRKRSLTLLSPQKITTRSTRELKRKPSSRTEESATSSEMSSRLESTGRMVEKPTNNDLKS